MTIVEQARKCVVESAAGKTFSARAPGRKTRGICEEILKQRLARIYLQCDGDSDSTYNCHGNSRNI